MHRDFELFLARQCAPLLLGKKPAMLFSESSLPAGCAWAKLSAMDCHILKLRWRGKRMLLLYRPRLLAEALSEDTARQRLLEMGYPPPDGVGAALAELGRRFHASGDFPHEVGFFLGYPPGDVIGFMDCRSSCTLCGQWKVYGDEPRAAALFAEYERCRSVLLGFLERGGSLFTSNLPALAG